MEEEETIETTSDLAEETTKIQMPKIKTPHLFNLVGTHQLPKSLATIANKWDTMQATALTLRYSVEGLPKQQSLSL